MNLALALFLAAVPSLQSDWPQFMGPNGDMSAPWPGGDFAWPEEGPQVAWRAAIGEGYGGVAVAGGGVFLLDREGDARDVLRVFDLADGSERWSLGYAAPGRLDFKGSRTVPTVVSGQVFTTGGFGHVTCFDVEAHTIQWQVALAESLGGRQPMFGWSTHPVVVGDVVIAAPLSAETTLVGLDRKTGAVRWRTGFLGYGHSTPALLTLHGREQLVMNTCPKPGSGQDQAMPAFVIALDPSTGTLLWKHETVLCRLPITPPVAVDERRFFVTGGYRSGSTLMQLVQPSAEEAFTVEEVFHVERGAQVHPPVIHGSHIYLLANENWNDGRRRRSEGGLVCLGLDGKEHWRTGANPFFGRGGLVRVGDTLLIQDGFDGTLRAVRMTPERYTELGAFRPFPEVERDGRMWAPPALAGTRLLLRSQEELVALELAPKRATRDGD